MLSAESQLMWHKSTVACARVRSSDRGGVGRLSRVESQRVESPKSDYAARSRQRLACLRGIVELQWRGNVWSQEVS